MNNSSDLSFEQLAPHGRSAQTQTIAQTLYGWLSSRLSTQALSWLDSVLIKNLQPGSARVFFARFSEVSRRVGKADLALTPAEQTAAQALIDQWRPVDWSVDQVARSLMMLTYVADSPEAYAQDLTKLLTAADIAEQVAWYQSLPLLPDAEQLKTQAIEGLRTNMKAVFDAIALHNPYPAQYFDELAWNQMILKALFIESPLSQIQGLDERANPKLARMLRDYAHERWAAGREVNPQLWRLIGPFAEDELEADFRKALNHSSISTQQAAALACASAPSPLVQALLQTIPDIKQQIQEQSLTWDVVSQTSP